MSIKDSTIKGVAWNSIGTVGAGLINFIITLILARLISPGDFGVLELLVVFVTISDTFVDSGFGLALIRDNKASNLDKTSVFYTNLVVSIIIYLLLFVLAPFVADFYEVEALTSLSRFVFLVIIFHAFAIVQTANFSNELNFRILALSALLAIVIAGIMGIIMAYNGYGVWALATNLVMFAFLKTLFLWILSDWRPSLAFSFDSIRKYFKFGAFLLLQGLVDKVITNLESLTIGKVYTKSDLGYFSQSRKFDSYLTQTVTGVVQRVTYPALSKLDDPARLKGGYRKVLGITMCWMIPLMSFVFVTSENVIGVLYGEKWLPAAEYLQLWVIMGLSQSCYSIFMNVFLVKGKTRELFWLSMLRHGLRIISIIALVNISILALVKGIVCTSILGLVVFTYFGGKLIQYSIPEILKDLWQIALMSICSAIFVYFVGDILGALPRVCVLLIQIVVMGGLYVLSMTFMKNPYMKEAIQIVHNFIPSKFFNKNK